MKPKHVVLVLLCALSFAGPIVEALATGRIEPMGKFDLVETFIALTLVYWWYHADKAQHDYQAGLLMNGAVLVLAVVALPVYFVRSRGWKQGALACVFALAFLALTLGLEELGEHIGQGLR